MGDFRNEFAWSKSRSRKFSDCRRLFWFDVYGKWPGWEAAADPRTREIYILSHLKSRWMWAGEVVHASIARILRSYRDGELLDPEEELKGLRERMRADFASSRARRYQQPGCHKTCALREHEYEEAIEKAEWERVVSGAEQNLRNFIDSPIFSQLKGVRSESWLAIDEKEPSFFLLDGVKVWVKVDASHRNGEESVRVIDWKTGSSEDDLTPLQLAIYALYAASAWSVPEESVVVGLCDLSGTKAKHHEERISRVDLSAARDYVSAEVREMESLLRSGREENQAVEESYSPTDKPRICRSCGFVRVCDVSPLKATS